VSRGAESREGVASGPRASRLQSVAAATYPAPMRSDRAPTERPSGLADELRLATRELHARAESSGILRALLRGRATSGGYALLLRSLWPVYAALEQGLERHRGSRAVGPSAQAAVYRADALAADLEVLAGASWAEQLPLLPAAERYVERVHEAARGDGTRLVAHAYVRFLGDLNGGRILAGRLARGLGLGPEALGFYAYPDIADPDAFRSAYRTGLDAAGSGSHRAAIVEEARAAFAHNIEVSEEVLRRSERDRAAGEPGSGF